MFWYYPFRGAVVDGGEPGLPSWVPDFSRRPEHLINEPEPAKFWDDVDLKTVQCAIVNRVLYIEGCFLDFIEEVIPMPGEGSSCFEVLQRIWQLDRVLCSNQRGCFGLSGTPYTDTDRDSRALLTWATTVRPVTLPLASKTKNIGDILVADWKAYIELLTARAKEWSDEGHANAKTSPKSTETQESYRETTADIVATHDKLLRGVGKVSHFLHQEMECDFPSACVFDFDNLDSQLESMVGHSRDVERGLGLLLSRNGPRQVVYGDLVQNIWVSSCPGDPASFSNLVEIVRVMAKKIHDKVLGTASNHSGPSATTMTVDEIKANITTMKKRIEKLEPASSSFGNDQREKKNYIQTLRKQIDDTERLLNWRTENEARYEQLGGANDGSWTRIDQERAAQFRGRQLFVTKAGLVGIACPGVGRVKVGDRAVLLDGMSFPVIARGQNLNEGDSNLKLVAVGCANIRGVKPNNRVEDVELGATVRLGPRQMLAFE